MAENETPKNNPEEPKVDVDKALPNTEAASTPADEAPKADPKVPLSEMDPNEMDMKQLKARAVELGMDAKKAETFKTKDSMVSTIQLLEQLKGQTSEVPVDVTPDPETEFDKRGSDVDDMAAKDRKIIDEEGTVTIRKKVVDNKAKDVKVFKTRIMRMKEVLDAEKKMPIYIPRIGKEKPGSVLPVQINGYRLNILKGRMVMVPESVAKIVIDHINYTDQAGDEFKIDRVKYDDDVNANIHVADVLS